MFDNQKFVAEAHAFNNQSPPVEQDTTFVFTILRASDNAAVPLTGPSAWFGVVPALDNKSAEILAKGATTPVDSYRVKAAAPNGVFGFSAPFSVTRNSSIVASVNVQLGSASDQ